MRLIADLTAVIVVVLWSSALQAEPAVPIELQCLLNAYPDHLEKADLDGDGKWQVVWKDGTTMAWDDGRTDKTFDELLETPDLQDQMSIPYSDQPLENPRKVDDDPGRIRNEAFFKRMYGDSPREVEKNLTTIRWMPKTVNRKLSVNRVNGCDKALQAVSDELDQLPEKQRTIAGATSGPYNWRTIKGTQRLSVHSFAIALDIGVKQSDYWRWNKPNKQGRYAYRNRIPLQIVAIFEKHGFIWGGRWYHFDTMHFEYRPELLDKRCRKQDNTSR